MVLIFLGASALANEESELETYGSYTALVRDGEIVQDVKNAEKRTHLSGFEPGPQRKGDHFEEFQLLQIRLSKLV